MIHYKPEELPELYSKIKGTDECRVVAVDSGIILRLYDSIGGPTILVSYENTPFEELSISESTLAEEAKEIYDSYVSDTELAPANDKEPDDGLLSPLEQEHEEEINENEVNLCEAVVEFLHAVTGEEPLTIMEKHDDVVEDFLEHALKYLYLRHGIEMYRPMVVEMADGKEEFHEYPYAILDFSEDEKNPVYMPDK